MNSNGAALAIDRALASLRDGLVERFLPSPEPCQHYGDAANEMTSGRLLSRILSRYRWYYTPNGRADLDAAWAYYEHYTLARIYKTENNGSSASQFVRAPAGVIPS